MKKTNEQNLEMVLKNVEKMNEFINRVGPVYDEMTTLFGLPEKDCEFIKGRSEEMYKLIKEILKAQVACWQARVDTNYTEAIQLPELLSQLLYIIAVEYINNPTIVEKLLTATYDIVLEKQEPQYNFPPAIGGMC